MKTDSLFYRLLQAEPTLAFELAGLDVTQHDGYRFISQEIKQTAFRLDGIAEPPSDRPDAPRGYVEVQFQPDEDFYPRFSAKSCSTLANTQACILGKPWSSTLARRLKDYPRRLLHFLTCPTCTGFI